MPLLCRLVFSAFLLSACSAMQVRAEDAGLAEDPFLVDQTDPKPTSEKPWVGRTPAELRSWAKHEGKLHVKLTARQVIDERAHPEWAWFRKSGLGLFLHWGLPSANPRTGDAWAMQWSEKKVQHKRRIELPEEMFAVAETWNPDRYDPDQWLAAAKRAGFGYSVLTTRHHDGYALWPTKHGEWDTGELMGGRDLIRGYVDASRKNGLRIGFYYSGPNWHYDYKNREFGFPPPAGFKVNYRHERVAESTPMIPTMGSSGPAENAESQGQVRELLTNYGPIDVIWWDGSVALPADEVQALQPKIFIARGNIATPEGKHQGASRNLKIVNEAGWWWEACRKSENHHTPNWHYGVECETNHWDAGTLLTELIRCRGLGGNLLVNIPPRGNGEMMDWYYTLCDDMAAWMEHSREAVYDVDLQAPLPMLDNTENYTTKRGNVLYSLPNKQGRVLITGTNRPRSVTLLRTGEPLSLEHASGELAVTLPNSMRTALPDLIKIAF